MILQASERVRLARHGKLTQLDKHQTQANLMPIFLQICQIYVLFMKTLNVPLVMRHYVIK